MPETNNTVVVDDDLIERLLSGASLKPAPKPEPKPFFSVTFESTEYSPAKTEPEAISTPAETQPEEPVPVLDIPSEPETIQETAFAETPAASEHPAVFEAVAEAHAPDVLTCEAEISEPPAETAEQPDQSAEPVAELTTFSEPQDCSEPAAETVSAVVQEQVLAEVAPVHEYEPVQADELIADHEFTAQEFTAQESTAQESTAQESTAQESTAQESTEQQPVEQFATALVSEDSTTEPTAAPEAVEHSPAELEPEYSNTFARAVALASEGRLDEAIGELEKGASRGENPAEAHAGAGHLRFEQGNWTEAARHYSEVAKIDPQHLTAKYNLALCLERQEKFEEAAPAFEAAWSLDPNRWQAQLGRGLCLLRMQQPQGALVCLDEAEASVPANYPRARVEDRIQSGRAAALHQLGRLEQASEIYQDLFLRHPESTELLANLISIFVTRQDWQQVERWGSALLRLDPNSLTARRGLAAAAEQQGDSQRAAQLSHEMGNLRPESFDDWFNLGVIHQQTGNVEEAITAFRRAVEIRSESAEAQANLGASLQQCGDLAAAREASTKALEAQPGMVGALWNLALIAESEGQSEEAAQLLRQVIAVRPDWQDAEFRLGALQLQRGDYSAAAGSFQAALQKQPGHVQALANLGVAQLKMADYETAAHIFNQVLELAPGDAKAIEGLTQIFIERGDAAGALDWYRQLQGAPAELSFNLGLLLHSTGDSENALACYRASSSANPQFAPALVNIGDLLKAQGHEEEAREVWNRALVAEPGLAAGYFA